MADDPRIFRLEARLKNNRLVKARLEAGVRTSSAAAEAIGVTKQDLSGLETLRLSPRGTRGFKGVARRIADFYGFSPEYLWPDALDVVKKRESVLELSERQVGHLLTPGRPAPSDARLAREECKRLLGEAMSRLTPLEAQVI